MGLCSSYEVCTETHTTVLFSFDVFLFFTGKFFRWLSAGVLSRVAGHDRETVVLKIRGFNRKELRRISEFFYSSFVEFPIEPTAVVLGSFQWHQETGGTIFSFLNRK